MPLSKRSGKLKVSHPPHTHTPARYVPVPPPLLFTVTATARWKFCHVRWTWKIFLNAKCLDNYENETIKKTLKIRLNFH